MEIALSAVRCSFMEMKLQISLPNHASILLYVKVVELLPPSAAWLGLCPTEQQSPLEATSGGLALAPSSYSNVKQRWLLPGAASGAPAAGQGPGQLRSPLIAERRQRLR